MGAISKIRQLSPYFLAVVAVLFIAFMVIQDSSCTTARQGPQNPATVVVGTVNGQNIYLSEYESRVKAAVEQQKTQNQQAEIDDEQIRQQVWDEMIQEVLKKQQAKKLGIIVTQQEMLDAFFVTPPDYLTQGFKDSTGQVNMKLYRDVLSNPDMLASYVQGGDEDKSRAVEQFKVDLIKVEDFIRTQKLDEALRTTLSAVGSVISPTFAELDYKNTNSSADVKFVALDASLVPDKDVKVSDEDISRYYDANKQYFEQKKARRLKYITFPLVASIKDTQLAERRSADMQRTFASLITAEAKDSAFTVEMSVKNGRTIDFTSMADMDPTVGTILSSMAPKEVFGPLNTPDGIKYIRLDGRREGANAQVRASHVLVDFSTSKEDAKALSAKVLSRARSGEDFSALAREFSKDPGSATNGGDLGFFGKGRMVKPFEDAAFAGKVGDVVGPVETQFGFHIIKITDKQSTEVQFSEISIRPIISTGTRQKLLADASMSVKSIEAGTPIDSVAKNLKLQVSETQFFQEETPIIGSRDLTRFAFSAEVGDVKSIDLKGQSVVVAQLTDVREKGFQPLEDIKEQLTQKLTTDKKLVALKARAESLAKQLQQQGMDAVAAIDPTLEVRVMTQLRDNGQIQGYSSEYDATHAAFTTAVGGVSKAVMGIRAWFIVQPMARQDADMAAFPKERTFSMQTLSSAARGNAFNVWMQKLRENAEIEDLRYNRD